MGYTKYRTAWVATDRLTAEALNHIESQWDEITADADAHTHDDRYYTRALADATFFSAGTLYLNSSYDASANSDLDAKTNYWLEYQVDPPFYTGFDADKLDGSHYSDILANVMPTGTIMIWSGTDATIPTGWHICDGGTYGGKVSPDLRDRFVAGGGGAYSPGGTMGPATWNGTISPTGTITVGSHTLTTAELPAHTHTYEDHIRYGSSSPTNDYSFPGHNHAITSYSDGSTTIGEQATGGGSHGHPGSTISFTGVDPRPPYHVLYYIMKYA